MPFAHRVIGLLTATLVGGAPIGDAELSAAKVSADKTPTVQAVEPVALVVAEITDAAVVEPPTVEGRTQSIGLPFRGRLQHGRKLEASEHIHFKVGTPDVERYATDELVVLLEEAARHVASAMPGPALTVGDLSRPNGGRMGPHSSHRNGRDADVVFYALDTNGEPAQPDRLVAYRPNGTGRAAGDAEPFVFDDARNWELVRYLLDNDIAEVQYIFISRYLRIRLLAEARRRGEPDELIDRASRVMKHRGGRHHDHFHLRILCAEDDARCLDVGVPPRSR